MVGDEIIASLLLRIHFSLQQGRGQEAEALLTHLFTSASFERTPEVDYLVAWCAASRNDWVLMEQLVESFAAAQDPTWKPQWHLGGTVRRRRPGSLILLGNTAFLLGHPLEALAHYEQCLRLLDERRMNISEVRLRAYFELGKLALFMGNALQAVTFYETALSLSNQDDPDPARIALYVGLCDACYQCQQFAKALSYGQQGFHLLEKKNEHQASLALLLGKICLSLRDFPQAFAYAEQAWQWASTENDAFLMAEILLIKVTACLAENKRQQAFLFCEQAMKMVEKQDLPRTSLRGRIAFLRGQVSEAEWRAHPEEIRRAEAAASWYEQAWDACVLLKESALLVEIASRQALLCEARGQASQALVYWKQAYQSAESRDRKG